jgi:hypothetical protein
LANEFDENISSKLERLSTKCDFYPHELDELRLSLDEIDIRIRDARTSIINIDFGNGTNCLLDNNEAFEYDNDIESPKIIIQTKPDIERILNGSYLRQFNIEIETNSNYIPLLYDTSNKHVNILVKRISRFFLIDIIKNKTLVSAVLDGVTCGVHISYSRGNVPNSQLGLHEQ